MIKKREMFSGKLFLAACLVSSSISLGSSDPLVLDVYYETLCPDTIRFYREQFYPTWQKLKDTGCSTRLLVDLDLTSFRPTV